MRNYTWYGIGFIAATVLVVNIVALTCEHFFGWDSKSVELKMYVAAFGASTMVAFGAFYKIDNPSQD